MGKLLRDLGLLTTIDRPAFESYCVSYGDWIDYTAAVHKHGPIVFSPNGYPMPSPYVALARAANKDMRALLAEFGMTPSSRTRVQAAEMVDEDTPLVEILRRRMGPGA
jgi:P27 family predicted phage terminase small subunit